MDQTHTARKAPAGFFPDLSPLVRTWQERFETGLRVSLACTAAVAVLVLAIQLPPLNQIEVEAHRKLIHWMGPRAQTWLASITFSGSGRGMATGFIGAIGLLTVLLAIGLTLRRRFYSAGLAVVAVGGTFALASAVGLFVPHPGRRFDYGARAIGMFPSPRMAIGLALIISFSILVGRIAPDRLRYLVFAVGAVAAGMVLASSIRLDLVSQVLAGIAIPIAWLALLEPVASVLLEYEDRLTEGQPSLVDVGDLWERSPLSGLTGALPGGASVLPSITRSAIPSPLGWVRGRWHAIRGTVESRMSLLAVAHQARREVRATAARVRAEERAAAASARADLKVAKDRARLSEGAARAQLRAAAAEDKKRRQAESAGARQEKTRRRAELRAAEARAKAQAKVEAASRRQAKKRAQIDAKAVAAKARAEAENAEIERRRVEDEEKAKLAVEQERSREETRTAEAERQAARSRAESEAREAAARARTQAKLRDESRRQAEAEQAAGAKEAAKRAKDEAKLEERNRRREGARAANEAKKAAKTGRADAKLDRERRRRSEAEARESAKREQVQREQEEARVRAKVARLAAEATRAEAQHERASAASGSSASAGLGQGSSESDAGPKSNVSRKLVAPNPFRKKVVEPSPVELAQMAARLASFAQRQAAARQSGQNPPSPPNPPPGA